MKLINLKKRVDDLIEAGYGDYVVTDVSTGYLIPISELEPETKRRLGPPRKIIVIK